MTTARITIEPMQPKYNPQVRRLLVHGFRGKFQHLTNMSDDDLALFFEKLFDYFPTEASNQRMIALQEGEVIGTLSIKWYVKSNIQQEKQNLPPWKSFNSFGIWNFLKLLSLHVSDKNPRAKHLYEKLSFHTHSQKNSIMRHFLFSELKWHFMVQRLK